MPCSLFSQRVERRVGGLHQAVGRDDHIVAAWGEALAHANAVTIAATTGRPDASVPRCDPGRRWADFRFACVVAPRIVLPGRPLWFVVRPRISRSRLLARLPGSAVPCPVEEQGDRASRPSRVCRIAPRQLLAWGGYCWGRTTGRDGAHHSIVNTNYLMSTKVRDFTTNYLMHRRSA